MPPPLRVAFPSLRRLSLSLALGLGALLGPAPLLRADEPPPPPPSVPAPVPVPAPPPGAPAAGPMVPEPPTVPTATVPAPTAPTSRTAATAATAATAPRDISALLAGPRERHAVPGIAGVVLRGSRVTARGVSGVRRRGSPEPATLSDRWHLGSCTKNMTATLCALLVEGETLAWDRTLAAAFPEVAPTMDAGWRAATLEQLLTNRSGAPESLDEGGLGGRLWGLHGRAPAQRLVLLEGVVARPPVSPPGTRFRYSNAGFSMAGAMAEKAAAVAYEDLIRARLFEPLDITTGGFGAPGTPDRNDEPRGHRADGTPVEPGPGADNPVAIAPAGRVHMTIGDWAKYVGLHLEGARGRYRLLSEGSFKKLHTAPVGFEYAMGWIVADRAWAKGRVLTHAGSNTMWYCVAWVAPEVDLATLVCSNLGGDKAVKACDEASWALIQDELAKRAAEPPPTR